jgi:FkbM family methyltransferase
VNFEDVLELFYSQIIKSGDLVVDIGAHSGRHCRPLAALVGTTGKVVAFEPNPIPRQWLVNHLVEANLSDIVTIYPYAIGNVARHTTFVIADDRLEESGLKKREYNGPTTTSEVEVDVVVLDTLATQIGPDIRFIKIDVEGAEFDALKGARRILKKYHPVVVFEFGESSYAAYDVDPFAVYDFFKTLDYQLYSILGEPLGRQRFVEASKTQLFWDYIACPKSQLDAVAAAFDVVKERFGAQKNADQIKQERLEQ